jgi:hypothetical protein
MRRCELAGARRLDLEAGPLSIEITRVVIDGRVIESDGKTENAQRVIALDPFTLAALSGTSACARGPAGIVTQEAGGAEMHTQRAITGPI